MEHEERKSTTIQTETPLPDELYEIKPKKWQNAQPARAATPRAWLTKDKQWQNQLSQKRRGDNNQKHTNHDVAIENCQLTVRSGFLSPRPRNTALQITGVTVIAILELGA